MDRTHVRTLAPRLALGLALLVWIALPIAVELRPEGGWEIPLGMVLNADPEPPWPMALHAGESAAVLPGSPESSSAALLPEPAIHDAGGVPRIEPGVRLRDTAAPAADLLILHQRRNE
jgi:hypothetical protein